MNDYELIKDDMYQALADETDTRLADMFFGYVLKEHHFQPSQILDACPDFFEELSEILDKENYTDESLKKFVDEQFIQYYNRTFCRY